MKKRLLLAGSWAFLGKMLTSICGLGASALIARLLSPEDVGVYFLIFSFVTVTAISSTLGLHRSIIIFVTRFVSNENFSGARAIVIQSILILALSSAVFFLFLFVFGERLVISVFESSVFASSIVLVSFWIVIRAFQELVAESLRAFHDVRAAVFISTAMFSLAFFLILTVLWSLNQPVLLINVIFSAVFSSLLALTIGVFLLNKKIKHYKSGGWVPSSELFSITAPLFIATLTLFIITNIDIFIVGANLKASDIAIYGAASKLVSIIVMPLLIINAVVPSLISELYAKEQCKELEKILRVTATFSCIPALIILSVFFFFTEDVLIVVFGEFYKESSNVLIILSIGQFFNVWAGSCGLVLMLTKHQVSMMYITMFTAMVLISGSIIVVKDYGVDGVAVVVAGSMMLQNLIMLFVVKIKLGIWTHVSMKNLSYIRRLV